jgi:uncharacterized protein YbjT (DUF2867 family)
VGRLRDEPEVEVRAAARAPERAAAQLGVEAVTFDFERPDTYAAAFRGVDAVFLVRPPAIAQVWNSIFPALDAAAEAGVERVVFLSLLGAEQNPLVPHRWIEWKLQAMDVEATLLRPSFFMQNLSTTHLKEIRDEGRIYVPAGDGRTSFIDARDVAAVGAECLVDDRHAGRAYALTGPEALTYHEVASILREVLDRPIQYADPSPLDFIRYSRERGRPWAFVLVMTGIYLTARFGLAGRLTSDVEDVLGRPATSFRTFARDAASTWQRAPEAVRPNEP